MLSMSAAVSSQLKRGVHTFLQITSRWGRRKNRNTLHRTCMCESIACFRKELCASGHLNRISPISSHFPCSQSICVAVKNKNNSECMDIMLVCCHLVRFTNRVLIEGGASGKHVHAWMSQYNVQTDYMMNLWGEVFWIVVSPLSRVLGLSPVQYCVRLCW